MDDIVSCASCGAENPSQAKFCMECAAPLAVPRTAAEERKVVTTLFCDLVAFTAMSEAADPEDVDAVLRTYHAAARKVIESHGGTVEKFIGDAVVGVFGVPAVHEDDPERAVRAGLRIVEALEGMTRPDGSPLQVRVGINTGEALVRLDVTPVSGEGFLTGDAVNTAARLQAAAPPMGVVVGEATHGLTSRQFDHVELEPATLKGKAAPVRLWQALAPLARTGTPAARDFRAPLIGRETELTRLRELFGETAASSTSHFVLISGEPGVGKSRLVAELFAYIEALPELITRHQGRCLPYGENVAFWALAEIVRAQAGVLESDDQRLAAEKLEQVIPADADHAWLSARLRPLLGLEASQAAQEENFAAWRRFLARLAAAGPAVLVFEDLHWADEGMLAFLEQLAEKTAGAPLLTVATTRPVLFDHHPDYLSAVPVTRLDVTPLAEDDARRLVAALLKTEALTQEVAAPILERCAGNPLYAEEFTALLADRGLLIDGPAGLALAEDAALPVPGTVQAVIAARLDDLPAESKALLADAAVVGQTFWAGAVAALGEREVADTGGSLESLAACELIRPAKTSTMAGEREYAFGHALARDVAYGELPRAARARKHAAFATWLEDKAGGRVQDLSDVLAHHYVAALELAEALGDASLSESLVAPSLRYLDLAGTRAMHLDAAAAERSLARALELAPPQSTERPRLLARWASAVNRAGRYGEAVPALEEAIAALKAAGERRLAAEALISLADSLRALAQPEARDRLLEALALLEAGEPSRELVNALRYYATYENNGGRPQHARELADRALTTAAQLGLSACGDDAEGSRVYRNALNARGSARCLLGDVGGLQDLHAASAAAIAAGSDPLPLSNEALHICIMEGPRAALATAQRFAALSRERALVDGEVTALGLLLDLLSIGGRWDEALAAAPETLQRMESTGDAIDLIPTKAGLALLRAWRGETDLALPLAQWSLDKARDFQLPALLSHALIAAAATSAPADPPAVRALLEELRGVLDASFAYYNVFELPQMLRSAHEIAGLELAEQLTEWITGGVPTQRCARSYGDALLAEARGEHEAAAAGYAEAAARWHDFGVPYEEAQALLGQGRCLVALGRAPEAAPPLAAAREIFARLGAKPALAETEQIISTLRSEESS